MPSVSANNKRIAKNTLALYFRTFITMIVRLYTGRVMLQALGVENYGINAVVGGIVSMRALITSTMSQAIGRYITYALGKGDKGQLKTMFSTSINAQIVMAVIVAVVLEILGVWFLNSEANIPPWTNGGGKLGFAMQHHHADDIPRQFSAKRIDYSSREDVRICIYEHC